jgi:methylmalonyl-CoA carboxyltransferase 5S subunit
MSSTEGTERTERTPFESRHVDVTELILRDAHQSVLATRMSLADMLPACDDLDAAGYWSVECWGGATFDACIRFLNEDPWARLRAFRKALPRSRLQMLLRGQNLLGYRHYEDGVVRRFVERAAANGMDVFRVFDALNDVRNLEVPMRAVRDAGKHAQGTVCYTISPVHTIEGLVDVARRVAEAGADSICVKDMAALLRPQAAYDLVKGIKQACPGLPVHLHVHATTGVTLVSIMKAIEAGCDRVDASVSSLSLGPGHNPTESVVAMLEGTGFTTSLDMTRVLRVRDHFSKVRGRYAEYMSAIHGVDVEIFESQIPGGMISNMETQLRQQGAEARMREVLAEVPRVREDAGWPPLVTPTSQIVGSQAVLNVLMGRYATMTAEFADLVLGYYGATAAGKRPEIVQRAAVVAKKPAIDGRPADRLTPEWDALRAAAEKLEGFDGTDEDVLTYAMFPQVAPKFFKTRAEGPKELGRAPAPRGEPASAPPVGPNGGKVKYAVTVHGRVHEVSVAKLA